MESAQDQYNKLYVINYQFIINIIEFKVLVAYPSRGV